MRIGRFLVVVVAIFAAAARHTNRVIGLQAPASDIERVNAVVAELAVAPVPMPMPVVGDDEVAGFGIADHERPLGSGTLPERPIESRRRRRLLAMPNRRPRVAIPRPA